MPASGRGLFAALLLLGVVGAARAEAPPAQDGAWAERVQIIYDAASRSVERRRVKVWDAEPRKNLDFVWEPAAGSAAAIAADGAVSGPGKLVWRVRGSASYDPKTIYSVYAGTLRDGRAEGRGRLELRSGEVFDGAWVAGRFEGDGFHIDASGNRFEGRFVDGRLDGEGRLLSPTGEIFTGTFVAGLKHGRGVTRLAGGTTYASQWEMGREIGANRPDALADAMVGGLLKAQSGGDADRVEISTVVDERMTQAQGDVGMRYQHVVLDDYIAIQPLEQGMIDAWNGAATIGATDWIYTAFDWAKAPAYVDVSMATTDGGKVRLDGMELQVVSSEGYLKPMLSVQEHRGCVGFRPDATLLNHGWGPVTNATLNIRFAGFDPASASSRAFSLPVADFESGADVDLLDLFRQMGVDTDTLATRRFTCPSWDQLSECSREVLDSVNFGELAPFVVGEDNMWTTAVGTFDYTWTDAAGNTVQQSEPIQFDVALVAIEIANPPLAEGGDGTGFPPESLRFQDVQLPVGQGGYAVEIKMRGNKNLARYTARLKIASEMTSVHQFQPVVKFADGSERRGKAVTLFYYRPRPSDFKSAMQPQCYLPEPARFEGDN